jgi:hypothetical protein
MWFPLSLVFYFLTRYKSSYNFYIIYPQQTKDPPVLP